MHFCFDSPDPEETAAVAAELGRSIGAEGLVIALIGPLGAGKTVFVKGLAEGLGVDSRIVSSPTFVIAQQYPILRESETGPGPHVLHHVDLYRLEQEGELDSIGFDDLFDRGAVLAVEWADRFPGVLGRDQLVIELDGAIQRGGESALPGRTAQVRAEGANAECVLADWQERVERRQRLLGAETEAETDAAGGTGAGAAGAGPGRAAPLRRGILPLCLWVAGAVGTAFFAWDRLVASEDEVRLACAHPMTLESDEWGSRRVLCADDVSLGAFDASAPHQSAPDGIGGILFGRPLDLGRASAIQLEALPRIGPSRARAIVTAREQSPFESLQALERVHGIGPRTVEEVSAWLSVNESKGETAEVVTREGITGKGDERG